MTIFHYHLNTFQPFPIKEGDRVLVHEGSLYKLDKKKKHKVGKAPLNNISKLDTATISNYVSLTREPSPQHPSSSGLRDAVYRPAPPHQGGGTTLESGPGPHVPLSDHDPGLQL